MYVCICRAVSERRIAQAVAEGATTLRALRERTGLGSGCGKCVPHAYQALREAIGQRQPPVPDQEQAARAG